jgi:hypothetical protein
MKPEWAPFLLKLLMNNQAGAHWDDADAKVSREIALWLSENYPDLFNSKPDYRNCLLPDDH